MCRPETQKWLTIGTWLSRVYRVASCSCFTSVNFVTQLKGCANWRQSVMTMQGCQVQNLVRSRQGDVLQTCSLAPPHSSPSCEHSRSSSFFLASISWTTAIFSNTACCCLYSASCNLHSSSTIWGCSFSNCNSCSVLLETSWWDDWSSFCSCAAVASFSLREHDRASTFSLREVILELQASICCDLSRDSSSALASCCYMEIVILEN